MLLEFVCPANQRPKSTIKKNKPTNLGAPRECLNNVSAMLIIIKSCYFGYRITKPIAYSRYLICVSCSVHFIFYLNVLRAQRIIGFLYLNYPQSNEVGKSDHIRQIRDNLARTRHSAKDVDICMHKTRQANPDCLILLQ